MKSFEEHLRGAKAHNREDKIWLVTCFSGKMAKLCAKYGFPDDEDMFVYLIEHFLRDLDSLSYTVMTIPYIAEEMAVATDKTRYKDVKVRIPEEELAVLNCRVAKTGMSREQYIRCLIADTIPAEYPPADYRLIIRKLDELQEVMEALVDENPVKRDAMKLYITLQNVASTADVLRRAVMPFVSRREKK